jgi:hypothetical protein
MKSIIYTNEELQGSNPPYEPFVLGPEWYVWLPAQGKKGICFMPEPLKDSSPILDFSLVNWSGINKVTFGYSNHPASNNKQLSVALCDGKNSLVQSLESVYPKKAFSVVDDFNLLMCDSRWDYLNPHEAFRLEGVFIVCKPSQDLFEFRIWSQEQKGEEGLFWEFTKNRSALYASNPKLIEHYNLLRVSDMEYKAYQKRDEALCFLQDEIHSLIYNSFYPAKVIDILGD